MKGRSKFVRIVALILALLMFGSVLVVAIQSFALSPDEMTAIPNTGDSNIMTIVIIVAAVAVVALGATFLPSIIKKKR